MTVKERLLAIRLVEHKHKNPTYMDQIGVNAVLQYIGEENRTKKSEIMKHDNGA